MLKPVIAMTVVAAAMAAGADASLSATVIVDREGLAAMADNLAGSYALGADIDLGGADWTPIGDGSAPFTGSLRGNGHAIRNLVCTNNPSANDCRGLFGCTSGATVTVLATEDLLDWTNAAEYPVDSTTGICLPDFDPVPRNMFFKYKIILETE